ncbi:MAG: nitronate monooxygenase [Geminicoccaceae bacterium]
MSLRTRLTERFGIEHPILSAPMGFVAGGALASAVSRAGGLGLIGGGYGDQDWLDAEFAAAGNQEVGCGFITWSLAKRPHLLGRVLDRRPRALMLSFGDPMPFAAEVHASGAVLICQVQTLAHARLAVEAGAEVIVAQGAEAGGHGAVRGAMVLVPEVLDLCARLGVDPLVLAAGGIADGRGLAAALMLGADGVLVGTCLYAAEEARVHPALQRAVVGADGDATLRTSVVDVVRGLEWPGEFSIRVMRNALTDRWHGREEALKAEQAEAARRYAAAASSGDPEESGVIVGEAVGLVHRVRPAAEIIGDMAADAEARLRGAERLVVSG